MQELLSRLTGDDLVAVISITFTFVAAVIIWLSLQWRLHHRAELEVALKRDMLERGMSAEDIERILRAPLGGAAEAPATPAAAPPIRRQG
jgi:hypothetical protein